MAGSSKKASHLQSVDPVWDAVVADARSVLVTEPSLSNLLITVVRKSDGEGHAVLTVRTDKGDFVLDNLAAAVKLWDVTGYRYLKRQASDHTGRWVSIRDGENTMVGAVR